MKGHVAQLGRCVIFGAFLGAMLCPTAASAKSQMQMASFTVAGTNGYSLDVQKRGGTVIAVVSDDTPAIATVSATGGIEPPSRGAVSVSTYAATEDASGNEINIDLGSLGKISVSFQPSGKARVTELHFSRDARCTGPERFVRQLGTFTGTIEFHGENGYTTIEAVTAPGSVGDFPFEGCFPVAGPLPGWPYVRAQDRYGSTNAVAFEAYGGLRSFFTARRAEEVSEGLFVSREVRVLGPAKSFVFGKSTVSVKPPAPFSGRAVLRRADRKSRSWSGDLSFTLPGGESIPLVGSSFGASFSGLRRYGSD